MCFLVACAIHVPLILELDKTGKAVVRQWF
jgi:hypothetical protein